MLGPAKAAARTGSGAKRGKRVSVRVVRVEKCMVVVVG
jgi:hypothetical protein